MSMTGMEVDVMVVMISNAVTACDMWALDSIVFVSSG